MEHWYTLYTKPNAEYQVSAYLCKQGIQVYLPEVESAKTRGAQRKKAFFPCYLFARVDFERTGLSHVQWTPGLRRIVGFGGRPAPISDEVVNLIRGKLEGTTGTYRWSAHNFKPGDTVRITAGPLQGLLAVLEGPSTPAERVRVLLSFLGPGSRVHVPVTDLEKVSPRTQAPAPRRPRRTRGRGRRIRGT
jgi:transcriptional antiterminator RfaH